MRFVLSGVLLFVAGSVQAAVISAGLGDFSGSETLIEFSLPAANETQITTEYVAQGATFTGSIYTQTNQPDLDFFGGGGGQVATNWIYENNAGLQGTVIDVYFSSDVNIAGMLKGGTPGGSVAMEAFKDGSSLGSVSYALGLVVFSGIQSDIGFDQLRLSVTPGGGNGSGFLGVDDLRFESSVVPIPAAVWLFGSGLGLLGWVRRKQAA